MTYDVSDITKAVRIALDKNDSSQNLIDIADLDAITIDELIKSKIEIATQVVESDAPYHLLDEGDAFGDTIMWDGQQVGYGSGYIVLPSDFMRLLVFQMSDWSMCVTKAITPDDPRYALQRSRFAGVRGNRENPVVAIVPYPNPTGLVLEFFSCEEGAEVTIKTARYLKMPKISATNQIAICEKLYHAVVYYTAYLTAQTLGDTALAEHLLATCNDMMK